MFIKKKEIKLLNKIQKKIFILEYCSEIGVYFEVSSLSLKLMFNFEVDTELMDFIDEDKDYKFPSFFEIFVECEPSQKYIFDRKGLKQLNQSLNYLITCPNQYHGMKRFVEYLYSLKHVNKKVDDVFL